MLTLELTNEQLDELYQEMLSNTVPRSRNRCLVIYLRGNGHSRQEVARLARVDEDTVTNLTKRYLSGGLPRLLEEHYNQPKGQLEPHLELLTELFHRQPPKTVNHAIEMIKEATGVHLKHTACRNLLRKLGMTCRRCGLVPGKVADDPQQQQAQQEFHDQQLQPLLEVAKQGQRTVLLVDAAHLVMGAFLGLVWCFVRLLLPSACGRQRYNVLGAYNPITHEVVTVTNDTYINQQVCGTFLNQIAQVYAQTGIPITLVLDNARYQKCQSVTLLAKELGIERLYLPAYSPNLNLIERLWRFVKQQVLYSKHYDQFEDFKRGIDTCLSLLSTRFLTQMQSLMTLRFQLFSPSTKTENLTV